MTFRIFVAFDAEHDQITCDEVLADSGSHGVFEVCGRSGKGPVSDQWTSRTQSAIEKADQIVFICGEHTADRSQAAAELQIARDTDTPVILLWSRRDIMCTKPQGAGTTDMMYSWTPDILHQQLLANQRAKASRPVPKKQAPAPPADPVPEAASD